MKILSIETSCDETSLAILEATLHQDGSMGCNVLSHNIHSQIDIHQEFGGVFPSIAKREHQKNITPLFHKTLNDANMLFPNKKAQSYDDILDTYLSNEDALKKYLNQFLDMYELPIFDVIAVTTGPGLEPALWVGINFAKVLGKITGTPVMPINHMEGHIFSVFTAGQKEFVIPKLEFPALALLISGGHTELVLLPKLGNYTVIGKTLDDAVGEAFDKTARLLKLPYPGGPEISKKATEARLLNLEKDIHLPRPMLHSKDYNFSFSGLKTAVLYSVRDRNLTENQIKDTAREFENAVSEVLVYKTKKALLEYTIETLVVAGGVSANTHIQNEIKKLCSMENIPVYFPTHDVTGDNALMIGITAAYGYFFQPEKKINDLDNIKAIGNLSL